jgi:predicted pyridoxine 5'-phosphate oxidase superfamily flavin-nucleotide-binding protein
MNNFTRYASDIAFTPAVKAIQTRKGSRQGYSRMEQRGSWETQITPELQDFIAAQNSVYLATANAEGQPYIQHRGGPPGFLQVLDAHTLAFVDYTGNKQYISAGNLSENSKAQLFLMDYENRQRVKIWGEAHVMEGDEALLAKLTSVGYGAKPERVMVFTVKAWDANCPQHIPVRLDAEKVKHALDLRDKRIQALEAKLLELGQDVSVT